MLPRKVSGLFTRARYARQHAVELIFAKHGGQREQANIASIAELWAAHREAVTTARQTIGLYPREYAPPSPPLCRMDLADFPRYRLSIFVIFAGSCRLGGGIAGRKERIDVGGVAINDSIALRRPRDFLFYGRLPMTRKAQGSCNNNLVRILNRSESRDVIYKYCIRKFL